MIGINHYLMRILSEINMIDAVTAFSTKADNCSKTSGNL